MASTIEFLYLASGVALPVFYFPQITKFATDETLLASYSLSKSLAQFLLRVPTLLFALVIVSNPFMNMVLALDLCGRGIELASACVSLRRQRCSWTAIARRALHLRPRHPCADATAGAATEPAMHSALTPLR
jgi:hypothetical protein